eukprot:07955_5
MILCWGLQATDRTGNRQAHHNFPSACQWIRRSLTPPLYVLRLVSREFCDFLQVHRLYPLVRPLHQSFSKTTGILRGRRKSPSCISMRPPQADRASTRAHVS